MIQFLKESFLFVFRPYCTKLTFQLNFEYRLSTCRECQGKFAKKERKNINGKCGHNRIDQEQQQHPLILYFKGKNA